MEGAVSNLKLNVVTFTHNIDSVFASTMHVICVYM